jgi:hypothetical protein
MSLVVNGQGLDVPGVKVTSWLDEPKRVPQAKDGRVRATVPTGVVLHTSRGVPGVIRSGARASGVAEALARYQADSARDVSWHLTVDTDGEVLQSCDVSAWMAWHACSANGWTIGIELAQHPDSGDLWSVQVDALVATLDVLCRALRIPRCLPVDGAGKPVATPVKAWQEKSEGGRGERFVGVVGHRNLTRNRGPGDPGDAVMAALLGRGYVGIVPPV